LDEELIIMALLHALPEDYSSLRSSLFIQSSLDLQIVESAFLAEDNQHQHTAHESTSALRAFSDWRPASSTHHHSSSSRSETMSSPNYTSTKSKQGGKSNIQCYFCRNIGHTERECKIKKHTQQSYLNQSTNNANIATTTSESSPETETESHAEFAGNASTIPIPIKACSNLNADTGATRVMMGDRNFFSTLRPFVHTIRLANGATSGKLKTWIRLGLDCV